MPHIVIEYGQDIESTVAPAELMAAAHQGAVDSGLFPDEYDIKTRTITYNNYRVGQTADTFIHVTTYMMTGRSDTQKLALNQAILLRMRAICPAVNCITLDVVDMNRATYVKDEQRSANV